MIKKTDDAAEQEENGYGTLFVCATPIGNLEDISLRALKTLKKVDIIAAEDTRRTRKLLSYYHIKKKMLSYHEHNRRQCGEKLESLLLQGKNIALVSDAGTPGISDPGYDLIVKALDKEFPVEMIPGPAAFLMALVISGLPTDRFVFEGFLPRKRKDREEILSNLSDESRTMIFYESPRRLVSVLKEMEKAWGDRKIAIGRELTKKYEEVKRGTMSEVLAYFSEKTIRGEVTVVVEGEKEAEEKQKGYTPGELKKRVQEHIKKGNTKKDAVKMVVSETGRPKNEIYELALKIDDDIIE